MTTQTDVQSTHLSSAGAVNTARSRIKGLVVAPAVSTTCTFELRDGSATGRIVFQMDIPTNTNPNSYSIPVPGEGMLCNSGIYLTFSVGSVAGITVFYG